MKEKRGSNNEICYFRRAIYRRHWSWGDRIDYCPLCENKLKEEDKVFMAINNNVNFPNSLPHQFCVDDIGYTESINQMVLKQKIAKKHRLF